MTITVNTLSFAPANEYGPQLKQAILLRNTAVPFTDPTELSRYISQEIGNPRVRPQTDADGTVRVMFKQTTGDAELLSIRI